jgi:hypothetical protein
MRGNPGKWDKSETDYLPGVRREAFGSLGWSLVILVMSAAFVKPGNLAGL